MIILGVILIATIGINVLQMNRVPETGRLSEMKVSNELIQHSNILNDINQDLSLMSQGATHKTSLNERIETFIHLFYDWNYAKLNEKNLEEYVTFTFFQAISDHEDEYSLLNESRVDIYILQIYLPIDKDESSTSLNVMVDFLATYNIPSNPTFKRRFIVMLEVRYIEGEWRVHELRDEVQINY